MLVRSAIMRLVTDRSQLGRMCVEEACYLLRFRSPFFNTAMCQTLATKDCLEKRGLNQGNYVMILLLCGLQKVMSNEEIMIVMTV